MPKPDVLNIQKCIKLAHKINSLNNLYTLVYLYIVVCAAVTGIVAVNRKIAAEKYIK